MLAPTTIFNTVASFLTNTNLQHYSGEVHLSYCSQIVFVVWNMFVSAAVGFCAWRRSCAACAATSTWAISTSTCGASSLTCSSRPAWSCGVLLMAAGVPMTFDKAAEAATLEPGRWAQTDDGKPKPQMIARAGGGHLPIKHFGTNGGGFFGANSAHPFENPNAWTNYLRVRQHPDLPVRRWW